MVYWDLPHNRKQLSAARGERVERVKKKRRKQQTNQPAYAAIKKRTIKMKNVMIK